MSKVYKSEIAVRMHFAIEHSRKLARIFFLTYTQCVTRLKSQSEPRTVSDVTSDSSDSYVSVAQARRLLKITHSALFDLIKAGEIDFAIRNEGTALRYLLRLSDVENARDKFEQAISSRDARESTWSGLQVIRQLAKAGHGLTAAYVGSVSFVFIK